MESIFHSLKNLDEPNCEAGSLELQYLYISKKLNVDMQIDLADYLINEILNNYEEGLEFYDITFPDNLLIEYKNVFISKVNTFVKEGLFPKDWISSFTKKLLYESKDINCAKLGIILSESYLDTGSLKEVVEVFSKSGEYIFYLMNSIKNMEEYNTYLLNLAKKNWGTIKVFAITNMEVLNDDVLTYLLEEGYKDNLYEQLLINYIASTTDITRYISKSTITKEQIRNLSYIFCNYLRGLDFQTFKFRHVLVEKFVPILIEMEDDFYSLYCLFLIKEGVWADSSIKCNRQMFEYEIRTLLESEKWKKVFYNGIENRLGRSEDIIALAEFYDVNLTFEDLLSYLEKNYKDFDVYWYLANNVSIDEAKKLLLFFKSHFEISDLINDVKDIDKDNLTYEHLEDIIFSLVIKSCRKLYPEGKYLALCGIRGNINDVRYESIKTLGRYKDNLSEDEIQLIGRAYGLEPNYKLKFKLKDLVYSKTSRKKEFICLENLKITPNTKDIYLISTNVAGAQYRDREALEKELEESELYNLILEEDNPYDSRAIKIAGKNGYVIGYVPRKDNFILSNLLKGGKYLYCRVKEYDLTDNYIRIRIYLSYKDVLDAVINSLDMVLKENGNRFKN